MLAHNCAVLRIPCDTSRVFSEPYGDYHLALHMVCDAVSETNRREQARVDKRTG